MSITTINPATGNELATYEYETEQEVIDALKNSDEARKTWQKTPIPKRTKKLRSLAAVLRKHQEEYALMMTREMGKPIAAARAEIEKCAWTCEVYADNAQEWLAEEDVQADGKKHRVVLEPLGVILGIMPWNFPLWQAFRFIIPTILVGNGVLLKHATNVSGSALNIQEAMQEAGFPQHLYKTILADHQTTAAVIEHPLCQGVSLTGSTQVGKMITEKAGSLMKKVVMELGGSDPFIVLPDADIKKTAKQAVTGRFQNNGQSCIAAKRFIVHKDILDDFTQAFVKETNKLITGDPEDENTDVGPVVDTNAADEMQEFLDDAKQKGAHVQTGGRREGRFVYPTILSGVNDDMNVVKNEVFGPIAPIISFSTHQEAIDIANNSSFGLGASVWSKDLKQAEKIAREINSGAVFINHITASDPRMPFGGIKDSGLGRELSHYALKEFANIKSLNVYEQ